MLTLEKVHRFVILSEIENWLREEKKLEMLMAVPVESPSVMLLMVLGLALATGVRLQQVRRVGPLLIC